MPNFDEMDEHLEHHGVKGMRWGFRKKEETSGSSTTKPDESTPKKSAVKADKSKERSEQLRRKYGPDSMKDDSIPVEKQPGFKGLTPAQKKLAMAAGGLALAGGAVYFANKYGIVDFGGKNAAKNLAFREQQERLKLDSLFKASERKYHGAGLGLHWDKGVELPEGSVLQRLSTNKENSIRPGGFFAAFEKDDIKRYQAELPPYWKQWGYKQESGYMVKLKSSRAIKAPSGRESIEFYKKLMDDDTKLNAVNLGFITKLNPQDRAKAIDGYAKETFAMFSQSWANGLDKDKNVQEYFSIVKQSGYNALIDFNDSGSLAKTPLRVLRGADFSIDGHTPISKAKLSAAAENVQPLRNKLHDDIEKSKKAVMAMAHSVLKSMDNHLEHYGVKGMKWGKRKRSAKDTRAINKRKKTASKRRTLSDAEINSMISRLEKEKKLKDLVDADVAPGKAATKKILSDSGQKVARTVVAGTALYGIKVAMTKKFDVGDAAGYIVPKPKK